jgi:hypothetical protein
VNTSLVVWLCCTGVAFAQQGAAGAAQKPLERFLGTWVYEGEDRTAGGGAVRCESTRRWIAAGYFVESRRRCTTPRGELQQLEVYGYDAAERVYKYWGFNGQVVSMYATPSMDDAPIRWNSTAFPGRFRCSETFAPSGSESTANCESSTDGGGTWTVISAGKSKKTSP